VCLCVRVETWGTSKFACQQPQFDLIRFDGVRVRRDTVIEAAGYLACYGRRRRAVFTIDCAILYGGSLEYVDAFI